MPQTLLRFHTILTPQDMITKVDRNLKFTLDLGGKGKLFISIQASDTAGATSSKLDLRDIYEAEEKEQLQELLRS